MTHQHCKIQSNLFDLKILSICFNFHLYYIFLYLFYSLLLNGFYLNLCLTILFCLSNISLNFLLWKIYHQYFQMFQFTTMHYRYYTKIGCIYCALFSRKWERKGEIVGRRNCKGRGIFESFSPLTLILNTDCYHHISFMIKSLHQRFALLY